ncbi:MAG: CmcI family methyltransferase [Leptolyngbyaceae cyanobacterium]
MSYQKAVQLAKHIQAPLAPDRFVKMSERVDRNDLSREAWQNLIRNNYLQTWKGVAFAKGIPEITLYPMLLHELQPKTIIEIGAFNGGSAIWFADLMGMYNIDCSIYSIDIDLSLLDEKAKQDERINFIEGDCNQIESLLPPDFLATLPHPWFVTEDAHVNSAGIFDYFHHYGFQPGDYIIIEDTNKMVWQLADQDIWGTDQENDEKTEAEYILDTVRNWLKDHEEEYLVDSYYLDMYGYNVSKNWNSVFKRV